MRFLARSLILAMSLSIVASAPSEAREWKAIKDSGTIIAATEGGFQPFNYFEGSKLTGFEVELAEAIARKLGLKLEWRVVPFDAQLAALNAELRTKGQTMKFYDAAIAATVIARDDQLLAIDRDYDRLKDRIKLMTFQPKAGR